MKKYILVGFIALVMTLPTLSHAQSSGLSDVQVNAILLLLESFGADVTTVSRVQTALTGGTSAIPSASSFCHSFNRDLRVGDSGSEVSALKTALSRAGYAVNQSSVFDEATASLVSGFQERYRTEVLAPHGLFRGTGYVGPTTRAKLNALYRCGTAQTQNPTQAVPSPAPSAVTSGPTADLKINGADGAVTLEPGVAVFTWNARNANYCNATGGDPLWAGSKGASGTQRIQIGNEKTGVSTFGIVCGIGGKSTVASDNVRVAFDYSGFQTTQSTADLKINGWDGNISLSPGVATFTWSSGNADYCEASGTDTDWSGIKATTGSQRIYIANEKTARDTYKLTCGIGGKTTLASDSMTVSFVYPETPVNFTSPSSGASITPGSITRLAWSAGSGSGYSRAQIVVGNTVTRAERELYDRVSSIAHFPVQTSNYNWTVPDLLADFTRGTSYTYDQIKNAFYLKIRLIKDNSAGGTYTGEEDQVTFSVPHSDPLLITIKSPQANYGFTRNTTFRIEWTSSSTNDNSSVYVDLVDDSGTTYRVGQNLPNTGVYNYLIGKDIYGNTLQDGRYSVKVCAALEKGATCDIQGPVNLSDKG